MPGADDGVLVLVSYTVFVREGFGEPVGRADEGCFCVDILQEYQYCRNPLRRFVAKRALKNNFAHVCALLLACAKSALIQCSGATVPARGKFGCTHIYRGIG